jgi:hypothetical protein
MPAVLVLADFPVPVRHEQEGLDQNQIVSLDVQGVQGSDAEECVSPGFAARGVTEAPEQGHRGTCRGGEEDGLEEEKGE